MVIWIIGLSASGKTSLGKAIYALWEQKAPNTVFIDGDEIRRIFKHDNARTSYTIAERRKNAERICELCAWLDRQGMNVVCCVLSLFEESRRWNRKTYSKYFEVYIDVPMEVLRKREKKGWYCKARAGKIKNVVGVDIPFVPPKRPDYVFGNSKDRRSFKRVAQDILARALQ